MINLKIGSLNVWGLGDPIKRREIFTWLRNKQMNIYLLQETKSTLEKENQWKNEWGYESIFNSYDRAAHGVSIMFNNNFQFVIKDIVKDNLGRYIIVHLNIDEDDVVIVNIYGPNNDNPIFYQNLFEELENFNQYPHILAGDTNICLQELDKKGGRPFHLSHRQARATLLEHMETLNLIDIWRSIHPDIKQYTWRQRTTNIACRLDLFLISLELANNTKYAEISSGFRTDHSFISLKICKKSVDRGPGFFKLNTSLLLDRDYVSKIKLLIQNKKTEYQNQLVEPDLKWETIKSDIRGETIKYSSIKKRNRDKRLKEIENELQRLEQTRDVSNNFRNINRINELNTERENIYAEKTHGIMTRAKVRWLKDGEKNTKYFIGLEKRNFLNKSVTRLINDQNETITDFKSILEEQKTFYYNLYKEQEVDLENEDFTNKFFIIDNDIPILTDENKNICEGGITNEECIDAIKSMDNCKSPGVDGLPAEFYKILWNDISDLVLDSFNYSYQKGELSITQKQSIITLLPKKDKDIRYLKNWRPISLLNTDYKILTKCLANRLKKVLPSIIHQNQTGFLKDRYIGSNIRLLFDIIDQLEEDNSPGIIFSIDFMKAFDTVSWKFLNKCLNFFNFGESFKKWIKILQTDISSCVINTGWSSGFFKLGRGVRQGCPISPYLYLICAELLGIGVRKSEEIKGIKLNEVFYTILQFADDTQVLLDGSQESLNAIILLLKHYEAISGMKINFEKSEIARLGCVKNHNFITVDGIKLTDKFLNVLGIKIPLNGNMLDTISLNFDPLISKINSVTSKWGKRKLTLFGKAVIIKSLIMPQLIYQITNLISPPSNFLETIDNKIIDFLWDGKRSKINRKNMYLNHSDGGLKIPNVFVYSQSLKLKWIKMLADPTFNSDWKTLFINRYKNVSDIILKCNICKTDIKRLNIKNKFWNDTLEIWADIHSKFDDNTNYRSKHPQNCLWFNRKIKINGKTVFYRQWHLAGIDYIYNMMKDNGNFYTFNEFKATYNIDTNFLQFYGILNQIRQNFPVEGRTIEVDQTLRKLLTVKSASQAFYQEILNRLNKSPKRKCFIKWEILFDREIDWEEIFTNIYSFSNDPKLRNFQFKVVHNIFPNNKILHRMGIENSSLCPRCNSVAETLEHYLWFCDTLRPFWQLVQNWINSTFNCHINLSSFNVILGSKITENFVDNITINFIILHAKFYVHCCRWNNSLPSMEIWTQQLKQREKIEKMIAFQNKSYNKHMKKWEKVTNVLPI